MASSETARAINRSMVLDLIRTSQPISRAEIARRTGLQRSTVSLIVDDLISGRWVVEGDLGHLPRGRKPTLLYLNVDRAGIIGINIRPISTSIVLADLNLRFKVQLSIPTDRDAKTFLKTLTSHVLDIMKQHPDVAYEGIGVSVPGRVDYQKQRLVFAPNLGWHEFDLKESLEQSTGLPVRIENAANACALSEVWSGPHERIKDLIAVTVSEGIGTGIIANGQLVRGPSGAAGEFGHVCIERDGLPCHCGSRGCWEMYASNSAALRNYAQFGAASRSGRSRRRSPANVATTFTDILAFAERGDQHAIDVLEEMGRYLGTGMAMLVNGLAPSVIVVIGEVTRAWTRIGPIVERVVSESARTHAATHIVPADDAMQPRLRGTVAMVLQNHFRPRLAG